MIYMKNVGMNYILQTIKRWTEKSDYVMSYLHPRDLDPGQPMIDGLSLPRKFKSYVGLKTASKKLNSWLSDFDFIDISTANNLILFSPPMLQPVSG